MHLKYGDKTPKLAPKMLKNNPGEAREAHEGPERPRQAQGSPGRPREAQEGPGRPREAQGRRNRPREAQGGPRFNNANQKLRTWRQAQCSWRLSFKYVCILTTQSFSNSCKKRILARICHAVESPVVPRSPSTGSALPIPRLGGAYRVNT